MTDGGRGIFDFTRGLCYHSHSNPSSVCGKRKEKMNMHVSTASIVMICAAMAAGILIPVLLFLFVRKKSGGSAKAFFVGCGVMFLFVMTLESALHSVILTSPAGTVIQGNLWLYGLYGGFMAGLFEETGRFLAFRTVLRKQMDNDGNAWTYGAGHGGFEAFSILFFNMLNTLIYAMTVNAGGYEQMAALLPQDQKAVFAESIQTLIDTPAPMYLLSILERCSAVILQMALSLLVWTAVKRGGKKLLYYPLAILLHMLTDSVMMIFNELVGNVFLTEGLVLIEAVFVMAFALWRWKEERMGTGRLAA